ncbi:glycoside hydrolase family 16 protein [Curtobacterium sp. Csp1]|uniref:glycoside hydrolase family 16 protein n=1 Tax=unclassified Curtobacterium TaxID=257496 RepID=UPI00159B2268|nr:MULTISPECIES: glycoside hydrolase family 16 protein [unclassified Curtobacterium]QKS11866.1 glycoside hydrolase family 16 protein [Curtobacterium sp. csp3]QKS19606.1 glycoside hydrolase family 16 protein [Curtobacterium sp. Csp1]
MSRTRSTKILRAAIVLTAAALAALTVSAVSSADARPQPHPDGTAVVSGATPTASATPAAPPTGDGPPTFAEDFDTPAAAGGAFATTYAGSWQPYPDGMGGKYWSGPTVSAHDGYMDVAMDGKRGAAGTFGTPDGAWAHTGGVFSVRARAIGGDGNGAAFMLWPMSDRWSDGEVDFPEGNFAGPVGAFVHSTVPGQERQAAGLHTDASWRDWHTYTTVWEPGRTVRFYVDAQLVFEAHDHVPTTPHRYMFQIGDWGAPGHLEIDWVRTWTD